jgi:hypothetical protein
MISLIIGDCYLARLQPFRTNIFKEEIMNIDKVISNFDIDQFNSDCLIHVSLRTYMKKKSKLSSCDDNEANMLGVQLKEYSEILGRCIKNALCFPSGCKECEGMQKCADCLKQEDLGDAFIELRKYL